MPLWLAPQIQSRGDEIAALRRLPEDLVLKLKAAGTFRMAMPKAWGGPEMTPREQCAVYETLGAADASVAWCVKIGSDGGYFVGFLEDTAARALYTSLDAVTAGQVLAQHGTGWQRQQRLRDRGSVRARGAHAGVRPDADAPSAALLLLRHVPGELARHRAGSCAPRH
jgi:alkylation response protein AidB-like acyl-CoA dehydrogenase